MTENMEKFRPREFTGLAVNSGKVIGPACLYSAEHHKSVKELRIAESETPAELANFENALRACTLELETSAISVASKVGKAEAEIFLTQKHIMNDAVIVDQIRAAIAKDRKNAEFAVFEAFSRYEEKFMAMENSYLRERAADIGELRRLLLDKINKTKPKFACEGQEHCQLGKNRVIVAEELTVDMMARMNFEKVRGLVTEHGGVSSHAAIIARSLGIPAVSGVRDIMRYVKCGDRVLLDGDKGIVYLNPSDELMARVMPPIEAAEKEDAVALVSPHGMEVQANASGIDDVLQARAANADGIGLFRTEIFFLKEDRLLDEDEQYAFYSRVADGLPGKTVTFRLLDVGGDKPLPFLRIKKENNPYLGWRGARFLLGNPDILSMQVRALVRLSKRQKVRILFPMVVDAAQQGKLIDAVREIIVTGQGRSENIELGVMFEVPSACLQARELYKQIDFGSVGSNDLIQYLFAVDRTNEQVSDGYDPHHPILWSILQDLVVAAHEAGKGLSICGEMAGREGMVERLLAIGISSLSVSPRLIGQVRREMVRYAAGKK
jgi:phosphotransferase system enzyme I (PtsI)